MSDALKPRRMTPQLCLMLIAVWIELAQIEKLEGQIEATLKVGLN